MKLAAMLIFGGGRNLSVKQKTPLLIEHHGNKLAFFGCNAVGPSGAFATENLVWQCLLWRLWLA